MPLSNSSELQENVYSNVDNASPLRALPQVDLCKRGEIRAERFLDAATEVFIEKGYQHARLSEIVARAGGSLATLYRIFGDKEGLAHAILQRRMDSHIGALRGISLSGLPPEQALPEMAMRMAAIMSQPESQVVYRIVIGEGHSFPALRDWFFDHAVAASRSTLADYFQQEVDAGRLQLASPRMAAAQFYMSLFGDLVVRLASGASGLPSPEQLKAEVQASVELFLRGALPR
ncbi:transcriptional regulator, TetR family [Pseudoxanthomonas wuyuanensis]|uniref:Transcriptional regulator, TetR family n=1 Tax=Pseudoxanthomonas wuyuanensis TaxID=1073196 RepID=A0A286D907_9GAMM|nr:transcriptional regulator, TetR family [Pseudoxanthomonas wuyuanensis]